MAIKKNKKHEKVIPAINELPKFNAYNKELFYKIYIPDLLTDILLIVFSFFVSEELFSNSGIFVQLESWQIVAMYCIVVLTLPWYLGFIYVRNSAFYSKRIMKIFLWLFILMTIMILVYLIRLIITEWKNVDDLKGIDAFTAAFATFLLVLGPMMCMGGAASAHNSFSPEGDASRKFNPDKTAANGVLIMIVLAIAFMVYFVGLFEGAGNWVVFLAYFGGPLVAVIVYGLFLGFLFLLDKIGIYKYLSLFAQNLFPFFIISVLVFWAGVAVHFMTSDFSNSNGKLSVAGMLFSVCVSGLVPFRVLMMFNAPLRLVNILIGIISLGYFFIQMAALTR